MSIECGECERDLRGGHDEGCSRFTPHPKDICQCLDYREDHENGTGACRMPNNGVHAGEPCNAFLLREQHVDEEV